MQIPYRKPGKYSQQAFDPLMTQIKFAELSRTLEKLKASRPALAAEVARLALLGDFSENVEYQLAKGRLRGLNQRILELGYQVDHAIIIEQNNSGSIQVGSTVVVEVDGQKKTFQILGSVETNPAKGIISHTSPIGAALIGHKAGETVEVMVGKSLIKHFICSIQ
ncbi:MAG: GreA/GreB family elongation factor [Candidatus Magasanikbacteria bacterium]|nr:GreA/GreB family elongation factor [Candidatus Magasanikbacteria bacterium]